MQLSCTSFINLSFHDRNHYLQMKKLLNEAIKPGASGVLMQTFFPINSYFSPTLNKEKSARQVLRIQSNIDKNQKRQFLF